MCASPSTDPAHLPAPYVSPRCLPFVRAAPLSTERFPPASASALSPCADSFPSLTCHGLHETPQLEVIYFSSWPSQRSSHQLVLWQSSGSTCLSCLQGSGQAPIPSAHRTATEGTFDVCAVTAFGGHLSLEPSH